MYLFSWMRVWAPFRKPNIGLSEECGEIPKQLQCKIDFGQLSNLAGYSRPPNLKMLSIKIISPDYKAMIFRRYLTEWALMPSWNDVRWLFPVRPVWIKHEPPVSYWCIIDPNTSSGLEFVLADTVRVNYDDNLTLQRHAARECSMSNSSKNYLHPSCFVVFCCILEVTRGIQSYFNGLSQWQ